MVWAEVPNPVHEVQELPAFTHMVVQAPNATYLVPMDEIPWFLDRTPEERTAFEIEVSVDAVVKPTALIDASTVLNVDVTATSAAALRGTVAPVISISALSKAVLARSGSVSTAATVTAISRAALRGSISGAVTLSAATFPIARVTGEITIDVTTGESIPRRSGDVMIETTIQSIAKKVSAVSGALAPVVTVTGTAKKVMSSAGSIGVATTLSAASSKVVSSAGATATEVAVIAAVKKVVSVAGSVAVDSTLAASKIGPVYARAGSIAAEVAISAVNSMVTFANQGMDKLNDQTISNLNWTTITSFTVRSGFEGTVIDSGNGLLVPAGVSVTIAAQQERGGGHSGNGVRLIDDAGTVLATAPSTSNVLIPMTYSFTPTVDTVVRMQGYCSSGLSNRPLVKTGANTYMTVTKN